MPNFLGDFVSGLGYAASSAFGRPIQLAPGGLGAKISGVNNPTYSAAQAQAPAYSPPQPQSTNYGNQNVYPSGSVLGASRGPSGGGGGTPSSGYNQGIQQVQQQQDNGFSQIESEYNQAMDMFNSQEQGLRGQAGTAQSQIEGEATKAKNEVQNTQTTAEQGVNSSLQTAEKQGTSAMQQARDLFRQQQQSNTAQLSGLGISSSSVTEALAERLGVETARRIAGVTGSVQEARQNAVNELGRVKTYYQGKIADIQNQVEVQKSNIQNSLVQGLNQINSARNQASSNKAQARANILSQAQSAINQLAQQQQQFEQSLQQWASQKQAALQPVAEDPNYFATIARTQSTLNQQFAPSGFSYAPQFSTDPSGNIKGNINYSLQKSPSKKPEDELINPFAGQ